MKTILFTVLISSCLAGSCSTNEVKPANTVAPTVVKQPNQPPDPKDGNYNGKGTVSKIDLNIGSVELNHEKIEGLMPAMIMEFYVTDKALLKGIAVGDKVDFVVEYKKGTEKINSIQKAK